MKALRIKHTVRLPPALSRQLADYAARKRVSQALVVETALASFLSPDGSERLEAAIGRRLDRLSRQADKLAYHVELGNEAVALFVRFWLSTTPPLPDAARPAATAQGKERYAGFIDGLMRRMEQGPRLTKELTDDVAPPTADDD